MVESVDEIEALHEATRKAHEVLKDLRVATKEARKVLDEIPSIVDGRIALAVTEGLGEFRVALDRAIEDSTALVFKRFDTITDILTGEDRTSKRQGKLSVTELIERRKLNG